MKKKLWILVAVMVMVLVLSLALFGCKKKPDGGEGGTETPGQTDDPGQGGTGGDNVNPNPDQTPVDSTISTPTGLAVQNGRASWKRVTGATFELEINGTVLNVGNAINYNLIAYGGRPADGVFNLRVRALKDGNASAWSDSVRYTHVGSALITPTVTGLNGTTLTWTALSSDAKGAELVIAGASYQLASTATGYDLSAVTQKSEVSLTAKGDGVYYKDSATVRLVYDPAGGGLSYAGPTNAHMEGEVLHFDRVEGANIYYLCDVYNTVTYITGEDINSLSSDRQGHFLIKSMWAGNTDLPIGNSAPADVTYFTQAQGAGTQSNPYLISTLSEMRYIEYYEAVNQSCNYKLQGDIVFPTYSPAKDEDYSNFYNLGSLSGVLDGDGHSLKNIVVWYKDGYSSIFDNITATGVIKNLVIEDTNWRTWTNRTNDGIMHEKGGECAVLAYTNRGTIDNVTLASGEVHAIKDGAAGLVSINRNLIKNCKVLEGATIYGANEVGAFAIYNEGRIEGCQNYGSVSGVSTVGGIVGRNAGTVINCGNYGAVTGEATVGGIVGYNYNIKIDADMQYETNIAYCCNYGAVGGMSFVGGIAGRNGSTGYNELGVESYANAGIYGSYNRGDITGTIAVGGLVGENNAYYEGGAFGVHGCYSSGIVSVGEGFQSGYIYLSVADCTWAENDNELIFVHYWKGTDTGITNWPGAQMQKTQIDGHDFYVVAIAGGNSAANITGLVFSRVNPNDTSGGENSVHNKTVDIEARTVGGALVYAINNDWTSATAACAGALAGYNNMINDCYYANPSGSTLPAVATGVSNGVQAMGSGSDKAQIAAHLNEVLGEAVFVSVNNTYPVLKWEIEN